jgi:hypothetical protein
MSKWSDDAFLDGLRRQSDVLADACVARLPSGDDFAWVFRMMNSNSESPNQKDMPEVLREFFDQTSALPPDVDRERLQRGEKVFSDHALPAALVMLAKSLQEGYGSPNLSTVLHLSRDLEDHAYRRLLGVLQMVVNVSSRDGFEPQGKAVVTAQKLRLLHAGIRRFVPKTWTDHQGRGAIPINLEDKLGTLMGFSSLVLEGLKQLGIKLSAREVEDYYYLWRIFGQLMGIHPPGEPGNTKFLPSSMAEAREFYQSFKRRNYTGAGDNPLGVKLAKANLDMMEKLLPEWLTLVGLRRRIPQVYMQDLIGKQGCRRVGIPRVRGHFLLKWLLLRSLQFVSQELKRVNIRLVPGWSELFFEKLITEELGKVTFLIPQNAEDLRKLIEGSDPLERQRKAA